MSAFDPLRTSASAHCSHQSAAYLANMNWRLRRAFIVGCCAAILCGNRSLPLWQGLILHRPFNASVACVRGTLSKVGIVSVSLGSEAEYGDARVFYRRPNSANPSSPLFEDVQGAKDFNPEVMVALTKAPGMVAIYMDAVTRQSSQHLWTSLVRKCAVTDLGR